jgi:DNA-binding MarR family transcriptional regulator
MKDKNDSIFYVPRQAVRMYNEEASKYDEYGYRICFIEYRQGRWNPTLGPKMGMEATSLTRTFKINGGKGSNYSKENPEDGRGVLIYLTDFGKEKENYLKNTVEI